MFQTCKSYKNKLISFHIYPNDMFVPMDSKEESTGGGGVARKSLEYQQKQRTSSPLMIKLFEKWVHAS